MKKRAVAVFAPEFYPVWGGVGTYTINLVKYLDKKNSIKLHIFTPYRGYSENELKRKLCLKNARIFFVSKAKDYFFYNLKFQLGLFFNFGKYDKKYNYDVIHSMNLVNMPDIFLKLFSKQKKPVITTCHTSIRSQVYGILNKKIPLKLSRVEFLTLFFYPVIRFFEKIYLKKSKNLIFVSEKTRKKFEISRFFTTRVYNGIDFKIFKPVSKEAAKREIEKIFPGLVEKTKGKKVILYYGRLINQKGFSLMQEIIKNVEQKRKDVLFIFVGNWNKLRMKKRDNMLFFKYIDNEKLPYLLSLVDIYVLPSYNENFPFTLLEAISMRVPCVASDVGAIPEIIKNGYNGFLVRRGYASEFSKAILQLLGDIDLYKKIRNNSRESIIEFNAERLGKETLSFYNKVLEREKQKHIVIINDQTAEKLFEKGILEKATQRLQNIANNFNLTYITIKSAKKYSLKNTNVIELNRYFWIFLPLVLFIVRIKNKIDIIKIYKPFYSAFLAQLFCNLFKIKNVVSLHGDWDTNKFNYNFLVRILKSFLEKYTIRNADIVSCTSTSLKKYAFLKGAKQVVQIPTWGCEEFAYKKCLNCLNRKRKRILFVGRIEKQKNLEVLIKSMSYLRGYRLDVVGPIFDMTYYKKLKRLISSLNLNDVFFHGGIEQKYLPRYYLETDCVALNSNMEGLSHTVLEAMYFNKPIVTSKFGDSRLLIKDGVNGFLLNDIDNEKELAEKIEKAIKLKITSDKSHDIVIRKHTSKISLKKELSLYRRLA